MKPFTLKDFVSNFETPVVTRAGVPARIVCTDSDGVTFLVPTHGNPGRAHTCSSSNGRVLLRSESDLDLFFDEPCHGSGWLNIYHGSWYPGRDSATTIASRIYSSEAEAKEDGAKYGALSSVFVKW